MRIRGVAVVVLALACTERGPPSRANAPNAAADSLYAHGSFDSAQVLWTRALASATRGSLDEAGLLAKLANVAYNHSDYASARRLGDSALALRVRLRALPIQVAESRNALGLVAWRDGRLGDARRLLELATTGYREARDARGIAKTSNNLGHIAVEYGRFGEAKERFGLTRTTGKALGDARIAGRAATNLGMVEVLSGDPTLAVSLLAEARALAEQAADPVNEENALGQLALARAALGEPGRALATADSALAVARRHGMRESEASDLLVVATLETLAGVPNRAIEHYAAARALYDSLDLPVEAATVLRHESLVRASRGAYTQARSDVERALARHLGSDAKLEAFEDLIALVHLDIDGAALGSAAKALGEAERLAAGLDGSHVRVALDLARARLRDARHEPAAALAALRDITGDLETADAQSALDADWLRTRSYAALGQLDSAVAAGQRAAAAIERVGSTMTSLTLRVGYRTERHRILADVVLTLLRAGSAEAAFRIAEGSRGEALRTDLARVRATIGEATRTLTIGMAAERERLLREIDALVEKLADIEQRPRAERGAEWSSTSGDLTRRIREARARYEALVLRQSEDADVDPRHTLLSATPVSAAVLRGALRPAEALVEYFATRDTLIAFVLTRARLRALTIPGRRDDLDRRVRLVRGLIGNPSGSDASDALAALEAMLIAPVVASGALESATHLLLIPHGGLSYLPFAALRDLRTGRRLAERYILQELPAAGMLPSLRAGERSRPPSGARTAVLVPFPDRLPATEVEAAALSHLMPNAIVYRGVAATEERVRQLLAEPAPVHLATHGEFNASNPIFSSVMLAAGRGGSHDDGRLEVHEVLDIAVRSRLVFLSGCETGLGAAGTTAFDRTEDVVTLAEAFLLSGAGGVVATLWRVDDAGAAHFAERFYAHLATMPPAEALATTQRDLMKEPRWAHPYYWAAYSLVGDGGLTAHE